MKKLFDGKGVAIIAHVRPDGDAVGSALALYYVLKKRGARVDLYCENEVPLMFNYLKDVEGFMDQPVADAEYDTVVAVDCGDEGRMGIFYNALFRRAKNTFSFDHHKTNSGYARFNRIAPNLSSTCEVVYEFLTEEGIALDYTIAVALYTGLFTDTGGFTHSNTTPRVHEIAAALIKFGLDVAWLGFRLSKERSPEKLQLIARVVSNLRLFCDGRVAIVTVLKKDLADTCCTVTDSEGIVEFGLNIIGVEAAASLLEVGRNSYKISMRSKSDKIDVALAAATFGGGGHTRASGCMAGGYYEDVVDKVVRAISLNGLEDV